MKNEIREYFDLLNNHDYLYLNHLVEEDGNSLALTINPGYAGDAVENLKMSGVQLDGLHNIIQATGINYKIIFNNYVLYLVRNESFSNSVHKGKYSGKNFRLYSECLFINKMQEIFWYKSESKLHHYQLICCDHIVDVISEYEPEISLT